MHGLVGMQHQHHLPRSSGSSAACARSPQSAATVSRSARPSSGAASQRAAGGAGNPSDRKRTSSAIGKRQLVLDARTSAHQEQAENDRQNPACSSGKPEIVGNISEGQDGSHNGIRDLPMGRMLVKGATLVPPDELDLPYSLSSTSHDVQDCMLDSDAASAWPLLLPGSSAPNLQLTGANGSNCTAQQQHQQQPSPGVLPALPQSAGDMGQRRSHKTMQSSARSFLAPGNQQQNPADLSVQPERHEQDHQHRRHQQQQQQPDTQWPRSRQWQQQPDTQWRRSRQWQHQPPRLLQPHPAGDKAVADDGRPPGSQAVAPLHPPPRQLMHQLMQCGSVEVLERFCSQHLAVFNHLHVACATNRLAKCATSSCGPHTLGGSQQASSGRPSAPTCQAAWPAQLGKECGGGGSAAEHEQRRERVLSLMTTLEELWVLNLPQYRAREVANALWSWAKVGHRPRRSTLNAVFAAITAGGGAMLRLEPCGCAPQALANLAWGLCGLEASDGMPDQDAVWLCLTQAATDALRRHQALRPAQRQPHAHQQQHTQQPQQQEDEDKGQGLQGGPQQLQPQPNSQPWAGRPPGGHPHPQRQWQAQEAPRSAAPPGSYFTAFDFANLTWSFTVARRGTPELYQLIMDASEGSLHEFCAIDLANVLWALSTVRCTRPGYIRAAALVASRCADGFTAQGVANTAWALAAAGLRTPQLYWPLWRRAVLLAEQLEPQHMVQLAWAMMRARAAYAPLALLAVASAAAEGARWSTDNLARLIYALTLGGVLAEHPEFMQMLSPLLRARVLDMLQASCGTVGPSSAGTGAPVSATAGGGTATVTAAAPSQQQQLPTQQQPLATGPEPLCSVAVGPELFQDLSQVMWAHAVAQHHDTELLCAAAELCVRHRAAWTASPAAVQTLVWSFGVARHYDARVFDAAAKWLQASLSANPAAASPDETAGRSDAGAAARAWRRRPTLAQVAGTLVALAQVQHPRCEGTCAAVAQHVARLCEHATWRPADRGTDVVPSSESSPEQREDEAEGGASAVSSHTLVTVMWALTILGHCDERLLCAALPLVVRRWEQQQALASPQRSTVPGACGLPAARRRSRARARGPMGDEEMSDVGLSGMLGEAPMPDVLAQVELCGNHLYGKQLSQLFQLLLWIKDRRPSLLPVLRQLLPTSLRRAAHQAWMDLALSGRSVSSFQHQVYEALVSLGVETRLEQLTPDGLFSVDTWVRVGRCVVSVEANGPQHYLHTAHAPPEADICDDDAGNGAAHTMRMGGSKRLRDSFLHARGHLVLNVPYYEWVALGGDHDAQEQYLVQRLCSLLQSATDAGGVAGVLEREAAARELQQLLAERREQIAGMWSTQQA